MRNVGTWLISLWYSFFGESIIDPPSTHLCLISRTGETACQTFPFTLSAQGSVEKYVFCIELVKLMTRRLINRESPFAHLKTVLKTNSCVKRLRAWSTSDRGNLSRNFFVCEFNRHMWCSSFSVSACLPIYHCTISYAELGVSTLLF